jgi:hypothetical protein
VFSLWAWISMGEPVGVYLMAFSSRLKGGHQLEVEAGERPDAKDRRRQRGIEHIQTTWGSIILRQGEIHGKVIQAPDGLQANRERFYGPGQLAPAPAAGTPDTQGLAGSAG